MNEHTEVINEAMESETFPDCKDNAICFYNNSHVAAVDFSQGRYITKIRRLAEKYPDECKIVHENSDGSVVAQIPTKWVKISPPRTVSEEQRKAASERLRHIRSEN